MNKTFGEDIIQKLFIQDLRTSPLVIDSSDAYLIYKRMLRMEIPFQVCTFSFQCVAKCHKKLSKPFNLPKFCRHNFLFGINCLIKLFNIPINEFKNFAHQFFLFLVMPFDLNCAFVLLLCFSSYEYFLQNGIN